MTQCVMHNYRRGWGLTGIGVGAADSIFAGFFVPIRLWRIRFPDIFRLDKFVRGLIAFARQMSFHPRKIGRNATDLEQENKKANLGSSL